MPRETADAAPESTQPVAVPSKAVLYACPEQGDPVLQRDQPREDAHGRIYYTGVWRACAYRVQDDPKAKVYGFEPRTKQSVGLATQCSDTQHDGNLANWPGRDECLKRLEEKCSAAENGKPVIILPFLDFQREQMSRGYGTP